MTTWLVRKSGSDSNGGTSASVRSSVSDGVTNGTNTLTSASNPWVAGDVGHGITIAGTWRLVATFVNAGSITFSGATIASGSGKTCIVGGALLTIGKALAAGSIVAAGDSIYVGSGVYREVVTVAISGTAGNVISIIADVDGVVTGDAGEVQWTAYTTNDTTSPAGTLITLGSAHNYLTFVGLFLIGGTALIVTSTSVSNITFQQCTAIQTTGSSVAFSLAPPADAAANFLVDRCILVGFGFTILSFFLASSTVADYDAKCNVRNCLIYHDRNANPIDVQKNGANTFLGGGVLVENCTFFGGQGLHTTSCSGVYPLVGINNHFADVITVAAATTGFLGSIVEDNNLLHADGTVRTNVAIGPLDVGAQTYAPLYEIGQALATGRASRPAFQPLAGSPVLGFGNISLAVGVPGTAADDTTVGTIAWGTPNNGKYPNDSNVATAALTAGTTSHYLKVTNFGFAIPAGATITQIRVEIVMNKNAGTGLLAGTGNSCKLTKDGTTFVGTDHGTSLPVPTTTNTIYSVGSAGDLWGTTWVPADLNSANFGVGISFKETGGSNAVTPQVDYVRVVVNYTPTSLPTAQTQDLTGGPRPAGGSATNAVGAFERGNTAIKETSTTHTGSNALKLPGPGYQDKQLDVDAVSTVVSVYLRYDSSYGGATLPTLSVLNGTECGVANASASQVGAANTWEKVSLTLVPTGKGRVTLRVTNLSTAAAGNVYADTWGVA